MTQEAMPSLIGNRLLPLLRRRADTWFDGTMVRVIGALIVAQLMVVVCSPDGTLFEPTRTLPSGMHCDGVRGVSLWCLTNAGAGTGGLPVSECGHNVLWACDVLAEGVDSRAGRRWARCRRG